MSESVCTVITKFGNFSGKRQKKDRKRKRSWTVNRTLAVEALKIQLDNLKQEYQLLEVENFRLQGDWKSLAWRNRPTRNGQASSEGKLVGIGKRKLVKNL